MAVLVAGGSGKVGSSVVKALSEAGAKVVVLTRDPDADAAKKLAELPGVSLARGDYSSADALSAAFEGVESAFLGLANSEEQVAAESAFIDAAAAAPSCKYLVKLGTCGCPGYTTKDSTIQYGRYHAEIEEHLAATTVQWTVLRPNWFMQNHMGDIFGTLPLGIIAYPVPNAAETAMVDVRDVGDVAAALLLLSPEARAPHAGQLYDVCGPAGVSPDRLASLYTAALGRPIVPAATTGEEWAANAVKAGFPSWLAEAVAKSCVEFWAKGSMNYGSSKAVLSLRPPQRTIEQWIKEHTPLSPPPAAAPPA
eukprot:CAMPEP_0204524962 /NCGR_PEP_ID=MMETSP0661-20131031/7653_1 /ASSEMBLY_ACC=CAM_ASM_000606 /TAXON_ID=109239 /ORGANISM="Alexandrium margalefi, Strain AMGDE01CS-322" /LENGTH=308 /DNA_ID=CAMNT_0051530737 /DNA_START=50 /DNA_END=976 /DNA_ORIENTATION=+